MLKDLKTDLKSLRYGKDRLGGGSSNQPYVKSNIPESEGDLGRTGGPDFLLRGGLLTPGRITKDTSRLTQMLFDFRSPNGLLFTAKQNILSRTSVPANGVGKALNNGVYLPTSTILSAAGNPIGLHLNKQGIDPFKGLGGNENGIFGLFGSEDPLGQPYYKDIVKKGSKSRLENYLDVHISKPSIGNLYEYSGGPGSTLGVGSTKIPLLKPNERTGVNNPTLNYQQNFLTIGTSEESFLIGDNVTTITYNPSKYSNLKPTYSQDIQSRVNNITYKWGVTGKYFSTVDDLSQNNIINVDANIPLLNSVYKPNTLDSWGGVDRGNTLSQQQIIDYDSSSKSGITDKDNFLKSVDSAPSYNKTDYSFENRIEKRVNLGNPGKRQKDDTVSLDKVNSKSLYRTSANNPNVPETNDLVKFRIGVIDNDNPAFKTNIHFRAFIDNFSDSYSADWQSQKFMGRGENFYRYNGFDRSISLSWTVVAQSRAELIPMYKKLNYLASVCAPDYSSNGYMRGNLVKLTIGGYLYEQVGIMKGITYTIPQESPWEIALPYGSAEDTGTLGVASDNSVKELSHMINVTGFEFIPIHDFVPSVQKNEYKGEGNSVSKYGKERYIALDNGVKSNYGK